MTSRDLFGSPEQQALLARGAALHRVTANDPTKTYYGRTVGLTGLEAGDVDLLADLALLQGNTNFAKVPNDRIPGLTVECEARGLNPVHYARWEGGSDALTRARDIIETTPLPGDLTLGWIMADTPEPMRVAVAAMALECGVLPPSFAVLSGTIRPGMACFAMEPSGRVVSLAGAAAFLHPDHPDGRAECWWGMLATHPEWRGARLSLLLGAHALAAMMERYGFTRVFTGVEPGNAASEAVCTRVGLTPVGTSTLGVADPTVLTSGRMTK
jgi:GNAT superfamily N-acetyltransferase